VSTMRIVEIWRYPVKSVPGEQVTEAEIGPYGIVGDRQFALRDRTTGMTLTARREPKLLTVAALPSRDDGELSAWLGRPVELIEAGAVEGGPVVFENPLEPFGETDWVTWEAPTGSFHDSGKANVSLVSTATIGAWDARRFRANVIVDGAGEDELVGREITIGTAAFVVPKAIDRCVMVTRPQHGGIERDLDVLRTIQRERAGHFAIALTVRRGGRIAAGDAVEVG
jgi:uncharacterized protein YcbX